MNGEVSRPDERSAIILFIIISIVRPFVPGSFVWGLAIVQLVLLVRAIPRHDWNTLHLGILLCSLTLFSVIPGTRRWLWMPLSLVRRLFLLCDKASIHYQRRAGCEFRVAA